jgi:sugar lactone lactonase YvrE
MTAIDVARARPAALGEGPTWSPAAAALIWVDILAREVHRFDPRDGTDTVQHVAEHVGAAKPRNNGGLVLNLVSGIGLLDPDDTFGWLVRWPATGTRGNDAAVDRFGTLWAGTMRYDEATGGGQLRRITGTGVVSVVEETVTISNGIGWSPDGATMYFIDTPQRRIDAYDVDVTDGSVHDRRVFARLPDTTPGSPDGLTVDAAGAVWVALWNGWALHRYTPDGQLDAVLPVPVARPTACAFGGPDLRDLYITTARTDLSPADLADQPLAGALLVIPDAGTGLPSPAFDG